LARFDRLISSLDLERQLGLMYSWAMSDLAAAFASAQLAIKAKSNLGNDVLLQLYALFKQGTVGDVSGSRPGMLDIRGRAKYDAWAARKGTSKDQAQQSYVDLVGKLTA
jgi:diazepam-binding inhibitor (GABA receptor modulator, acyl-CoA-binding protein)